MNQSFKKKPLKNPQFIIFKKNFFLLKQILLPLICLIFQSIHPQTVAKKFVLYENFYNPEFVPLQQHKKVNKSCKSFVH